MNSLKYATDIVRQLGHAGYTAYFAGGWVRDYLMGHPSEDIDIATDAPPEKILDLFPQTILVGLAFGVVVVVIDGHQFDVATFRQDIEYVDGRKPTHIKLSTAEKDASRRDFTINGMFYDPLNGHIHDFVRGMEDLKHRVIRTIGDPYDRFFEDRLRMIRAVRFAARFGFVIDLETEGAIRANAETLFPAVALERVWQEFTKMSKYPGLELAIVEMHRLGLLTVIFPGLKGLHTKDIRNRVAHFVAFSVGTETILCIMELFPDATISEAQEICHYLRISTYEMQLAELAVRCRQLIAKEEQERICDHVEWTYFYAHSHAWRCLEIFAAQLTSDEKNIFLHKHAQRRLKLDKHIVRVIKKQPLVNAALLQARGIVPGKQMGNLLREAERIAIVQNADDASLVINLILTVKEG